MTDKRRDATAALVLNALAIVVALCAAGSSHMTQAAEPAGMLTLACQGTLTDNAKPDDAKPESISMGIVLNFTTRTVKGFPHEGEAEITRVDDVIIVFVASYRDDKVPANWTFNGTIDRVTGDLEAHSRADTDIHHRSRIRSYSLKCKPAQRMF